MCRHWHAKKRRSLFCLAGCNNSRLSKLLCSLYTITPQKFTLSYHPAYSGPYCWIQFLKCQMEKPQNTKQTNIQLKHILAASEHPKTVKEHLVSNLVDDAIKLVHMLYYKQNKWPVLVLHLVCGVPASGKLLPIQVRLADPLPKFLLFSWLNSSMPLLHGTCDMFSVQQ